MTSLYAEPVHFPKLTHRFIHQFSLQGEPLDKDIMTSPAIGCLEVGVSVQNFGDCSCLHRHGLTH